MNTKTTEYVLVAVSRDPRVDPPATTAVLPNPAPLLVALPGMSRSAPDFADLANLLPTGFTLVTLERFSPRRSFPQQPWHLRARATQVVEQLQQLKVESRRPLVLLAHSFGGFLAEAVSRIAPDLVAQVVLMDSSVPVATRPSVSREIRWQCARPVARLLWHLGPHGRKWALVLHEDAAFPTSAAELAEWRTTSAWDTPTTVITAGGRYFPASRWVRKQRELAAQLNAQHFLLDRCGHSIALQRPEVVATLLSTLPGLSNKPGNYC